MASHSHGPGLDNECTVSSCKKRYQTLVGGYHNSHMKSIVQLVAEEGKKVRLSTFKRNELISFACAG